MEHTEVGGLRIAYERSGKGPPLASAESDLREVLPHIDVPTLILSGGDDVRAPLPVAEAMRASIPTARLVVLEGVGHVSSVEDAERFSSEVRKILHESEWKSAPSYDVMPLSMSRSTERGVRERRDPVLGADLGGEAQLVASPLG